MKRFFMLLMVLCLWTAAALAEPADVTIEALDAANQRAALLLNHESVCAHTLRTDREELVYFTADYWYDDFDEILYDDAGNWSVARVDGEPQLCLDWYAMSDEERAALVIDHRDIETLSMGPDVTRAIALTEVADNGDGTLRVAGMISEDDCRRLQAEYGDALPEEFTGTACAIDWIVYADTLEIQRETRYSVLDGKRTLLSKRTVEYDAPQPALLTWMLDRISSLRPAEAPNAIVLIYDAGADTEQRYSFDVDAGLRVQPFCRDGYAIYNDPGKTRAFTGDDGVTGGTLYAFPAD